MEPIHITATASLPRDEAPNWVTNLNQLWDRRTLLLRTAAAAFVISAILVFALPKRYESSARIMPPDGNGSGTAMLAALAGRASGGMGALGSLAGSLLGGRTSSVLFVELLHSRSVADHLIDRFDLQHVYHQRYRVDTVKTLSKRTAILEDKKSGVVSLTVTDTDPERARAIAQAYLDELNTIVTRSNTSSARSEREFIEHRLVTVQAELQDAQSALSAFSSKNSTLDIKEQTHAMVDAASKVQAQKIVSQSELASLEQIYGDDNVRVRAARARIADLDHELQKMSGSSADPTTESNSLYPSLRQMPGLAVSYTNLYRRVRIQETVFELLSQQYEMARIEEAKDTPIVSVIDPPLVPEKKSFPPRLLLILALTLLAVLAVSAWILLHRSWQHLDAADSRKLLALRIAATLRMPWGGQEVAP